MISRLTGTADGRHALQDRMSALISLAVAAAVALTGIAAYLITHLAVFSQLDSELIEVASTTSAGISDPETLDGLNVDALVAANVTLTVIRSDNRVSSLPGSQMQLVISPHEIAIARTQMGLSARTGLAQQLEDGIPVDDIPYRIIAVPLTSGTSHYALVIGRSLASSDQSLRILAISLLTFGIAAVVVAGVVGRTLARSGLRPILLLSDAVRRVSETEQLEPIALGGMNELTDLTRSFNNMMDSLASSREQQSRLIADASHELRTPLTSLRTNVELLIADDREGMLPPGARREILTDVAGQLGEFTTLVGDLVHLSREDTIRPSPEPIDLRDVVVSALERAKRRGPGLNFEVSLHPFYMVGEADSLERAVTNLLDNAIKFSPPGGTIRVSLERDRLRVSDDGPGIAEEDLPHIFERFYRSDKSRTTPGSGLGLSIVAHTVKAHGGWVRAENTFGAGAEFIVRLPGSSESPEASVAERQLIAE
ncbi:MAG: HAMP domain-containing histidine kinase [Propionibacteriaceae bacterium]|jgi:two-component system sensor histidine kinase MprB|nr:HAMP domain-containing histidine kinase [Propionibacteriaceae bacterium]